MNIYDIDVTLLDAHCKHHISHAGPVGAHIHQLLEHHLTLWYQKTSPGPQNMLINALKFTFPKRESMYKLVGIFFFGVIEFMWLLVSSY